MQTTYHEKTQHGFCVCLTEAQVLVGMMPGLGEHEHRSARQCTNIHDSTLICFRLLSCTKAGSDYHGILSVSRVSEFCALHVT